ncbi:MAG: hypothetical protein OXH76_11910 [Boseongicola sp.]|nr:hypothetical protein [Boseongicola sp.]
MVRRRLAHAVNICLTAAPGKGGGTRIALLACRIPRDQARFVRSGPEKVPQMAARTS